MDVRIHKARQREAVYFLCGRVDRMNHSIANVNACCNDFSRQQIDDISSDMKFALFWFHPFGIVLLSSEIRKESFRYGPHLNHPKAAENLRNLWQPFP